jgi:hypothetical protein
MRKSISLIIAALIGIAVVILPSLTSVAGAATAPLLPGEPIWTSTYGSVGSYVAGTNDTIDYGSPNVDTLSSVQSAIKTAGLTIMRVWTYNGDSTAYQTSKIDAALNSGQACYMMLGSIAPSDLSWEEATVNLAEPMGCHYFEFGNEPNSNGGTVAYVQDWLNNIPQLRALPVCQGTNACLFGGPAVAYPTASEGEEGLSDMAYFLEHTASTARADFISYHDYPCNGASAWDSGTVQAQEDCLNHMTDANNGYSSAPGTCTLTPGSCTQTANGAFGVDQSEVLAWEQQYYGTVIPTGISEYNFDPGSSTLGAWANDGAFMDAWEVAAIDAFVTNHYSFGLEFTTLNYAGYGALDMFSDSSPYGAKPQLNAMASEVSKYGGGVVTNPTAPNAPSSVTATAGDGQALVSWSAPFNGGSPITSYTVTASTGQTVTINGSPPSTQATVTGLTDGVAVTFAVTATNSIGTSPPSPASNSVTPKAATVPDPPTNVVATAGDSSATVSWKPPSNNGGDPILGYTVIPSSGQSVSTTGTSVVVTGLTNGTSYTFTVTANNVVGQSAPSAASNAVVPAVQTTPVFIQKVSVHKSAVSSASSKLPSAVAAGHQLVVEVGVWNSSNATAQAVTDSVGDTFTEITHVVASEGTEMSVWTATTAGGAVTVTATPTSAADTGMAVLEYSNLGPVNQIAVKSGTTGGKRYVVGAGPTPAVTAAGISIGFYNDSGFDRLIANGPGWTNRVDVSKTSNMEFEVEDQSAAVGATPTAVFSTGANTAWQAATIVFS